MHEEDYTKTAFRNAGEGKSETEASASNVYDSIQSNIKEKLLAAQYEASKEENAPAEMPCGLDQQMEKKEDGGLYFMDRIWVPLIRNVRTIIMDEAHATRYSIHPGADKMYYDSRDMYWWSGKV
ncbi:hypothetical protein Tco_0938618 [Tanacetum coccineum]|uniref:Reverse transcriptase domain-containing protein n=1 Tax=Tanacetum coccineum TaxID=301880 RepID=A0ABQ5DIM6_9ASTR